MASGARKFISAVLSITLRSENHNSLPHGQWLTLSVGNQVLLGHLDSVIQTIERNVRG
jgi:hypothetical protein